MHHVRPINNGLKDFFAGRDIPGDSLSIGIGPQSWGPLPLLPIMRGLLRGLLRGVLLLEEASYPASDFHNARKIETTNFRKLNRSFGPVFCHKHILLPFAGQ